MERVIFQDLGYMDYQQAWDYQERLLQENVQIKTEARQRAEAERVEVWRQEMLRTQARRCARVLLRGKWLRHTIC
jgi:hypothetical protein